MRLTQTCGNEIGAGLKPVIRSGVTTFTAGDAADPVLLEKPTREAGGGLVDAVGILDRRPLACLAADAEADVRINAFGAFPAIEAARARKAGAAERETWAASPCRSRQS